MTTLTILMPCLNESATIETCIKKAKNFIQNSKIEGEILVADNETLDSSKDIAMRNGARVIQVSEKRLW